MLSAGRMMPIPQKDVDDITTPEEAHAPASADCLLRKRVRLVAALVVLVCAAASLVAVRASGHSREPLRSRATAPLSQKNEFFADYLDPESGAEFYRPNTKIPGSWLWLSCSPHMHKTTDTVPGCACDADYAYKGMAKHEITENVGKGAVSGAVAGAVTGAAAAGVGALPGAATGAATGAAGSLAGEAYEYETGDRNCVAMSDLEKDQPNVFEALMSSSTTSPDFLTLIREVGPHG